ncbi:MAG TPA: lactate permease LctP family transporter [Opitutaceae bacterium]|nr:lactate permease LctP family transporter [Opitutaceae bacterium]
MHWSQSYSPFGGIGVSALVAALPVVTLLALLAFFHVRAHLAAVASLIVALVVAVFAYGMPASLALASAGYGAAFGLFPIGWIIVNAIFIYQLSVETGQFAVLQNQIAGVSGDRRIQALLIAFSFGAFIEGSAGFGAPVAITGALLIGLGFRPLEAAKLALIGNTAPVAFGSLGIPLITLAKVTGLDLQLLSAMVGRQLPFFSLLIPFWLVAAQVGWRGMRAVWPACLVTGASFGLSQFLVSNFVGPMLVDTISATVSMAALVLLMRFWRPGDGSASDVAPRTLAPRPALASGARVRAWLPWIFLSVFVSIWSLPATKSFLNGVFAPALNVPLLHQAVERVPPVVSRPEMEPAVFVFNFLSATGTALLLAGVVAAFCLGVGPRALAALYARAFWRVRVSLLTIGLMLALGFTTRYSGTDTTMGLALAATGGFYPFFSPLIGWLGVALTGSDTSSNVLFGNLQKNTAQQLGFSPILMAASNSSGGVMGKMIDAQSIVVASVATGGHPDSPDAGSILRAVFWHSVALALLMSVLVVLQAYVWPGVVPG